MKRLVFFFPLVFLFTIFSYSQNLNNFPKYDSKEYKCAKVVYSRVWEPNFRDTTEFSAVGIEDDNINAVLFEQDKNGFIEILLDAIHTKGIHAYATLLFGYEYEYVLTEAEINKLLGETTKTMIVDENLHEYIVPYSVSEITSFIFQEIWLYDFDGKLAKKQLMGICPVREYYRLDDLELAYPVYKKTFWVKYSDIQSISKEKNMPGSNKNFDEFFEKREYNCLVVDDPLSYKNAKNYAKVMKLYSNLYANLVLDDNADNVIKTKVKINQEDIKYTKFVYKRVFKPGFRDLNYYSDNNLTKDSVNKQLFYPEEPKLGYLSLIDFVLDAIHKKGLTAYIANADDFGHEYQNVLTEAGVYKQMGAEFLLDIIETPEGDFDTATIHIPYNSNEISSYIFQELWYYDFDDNVIQKNLVGLCPVRRYYRDDDFTKEQPLFQKVFWIYYPEFRQIAIEQDVFPNKCSKKQTFDNFLFDKNYYGLDMGDTASYKYLEDSYIYKNIYLNLDFISNSPNKVCKNITENVVYKPKKYLEYPKRQKFKTAKIVYNKIESKDNYRLFKPEKPQMGYKSMIDIILDAFFYSGIGIFETDDFSKQISLDELMKNLGETTSINVFENIEGDYDTVKFKVPYESSEVTSYIFKELHFFDKKGELKAKRIIAICAVREYYRLDDIDKLHPKFNKLFWVKYHDIKPFLQKNNLANLRRAYFEYNDEALEIDQNFEPKENISINSFLINGNYKSKELKILNISKKEVKALLKN